MTCDGGTRMKQRSKKCQAWSTGRERQRERERERGGVGREIVERHQEQSGGLPCAGASGPLSASPLTCAALRRATTRRGSSATPTPARWTAASACPRPRASERAALAILGQEAKRPRGFFWSMQHKAAEARCSQMLADARSVEVGGVERLLHQLRPGPALPHTSPEPTAEQQRSSVPAARFRGEIRGALRGQAQRSAERQRQRSGAL